MNFTEVFKNQEVLETNYIHLRKHVAKKTSLHRNKNWLHKVTFREFSAIEIQCESESDYLYFKKCNQQQNQTKRKEEDGQMSKGRRIM